MHKFGIAVEQMSAHGKAAAHAATKVGARTVVYREQAPVAAIVPLSDLQSLDPADPSDVTGEDQLLSLCGTFSDDVFVDQMSDLGRTVLFKK